MAGKSEFQGRKLQGPDFRLMSPMNIVTNMHCSLSSVSAWFRRLAMVSGERRPSTSVRTHLWVAVIAYLIIARIKADYKSPYSITEVATLIRISALEKITLRELITKPRDSVNINQSVKELTLF